MWTRRELAEKMAQLEDVLRGRVITPFMGAMGKERAD